MMATPLNSGQPGVAGAAPLRPMGLGLSLLFFGLPALAIALGFHLLMPALIEAGILPFYAQTTALGLPLAGLLVASLVACRLEGRPLTWPGLMDRFRFRRMGRRAWLWTLGVWVLTLGLWFLLQQATAWLLESGIMPVAGNLPAFLDPRTAGGAELLDEAAGGLKGNWGFLLASLAFPFFNVVGEEFWWRGYVPPRQELAFGRWTWVVHGLLWTAFHAFKWWDLASLLPFCLGLAFVVCRLKNNTPGLIMHALHKADFFLVVVPLFLYGIQ